ncbi:MAG TPA: type II toxin-antitoxin system VapC family toxin [Caulobacteraceae bacterium]
MIALDTNVLVRYLVRDDPEQSSAAAAFIESELTDETPGFVSLLVLAELSWVLRRSYGVGAEQVSALVRQLLDVRQLTIEQAETVARALDLGHAELADALIREVGRAAGCSRTVTFDQRFARLDGVERLVG